MSKSKKKERLAEIEKKLNLDGYRLFRGANELDPKEISLEKEHGIIIDDKYKLIMLNVNERPDILMNICIALLSAFIVVIPILMFIRLLDFVGLSVHIPNHPTFWVMFGLSFIGSVIPIFISLKNYFIGLFK